MTVDADEPAFEHDAFLAQLTTRPGVYRMYSADKEIIYVGKAQNLRNRVGSYFRRDPGGAKVRVMVAQIANIEVTITDSEAEALLLEHALIKEYRPRYNILLRDDKSYPYIHISDHEYPRLAFHRGARKSSGRYIGPYPNAGAAKKTLQLMQKIFLIRPCEDSVFRNRSRPCLQYQIDRCSAPCVQMISTGDYARDLSRAERVLTGRNQEVHNELVSEMDSAAQALAFERAAHLRDCIRDLRLTSEQGYAVDPDAQIDLVAVHIDGGLCCVQVFVIRNGVALGNRAHFPALPGDEGVEGVLYAFLTQYYLTHEIPHEILINTQLSESALLVSVFSERAKKRVKITAQPRGDRARWLANAQENAALALAAKRSSRSGQQARVADLVAVLALDEPPQRIECFDISHSHGEATVASCVVFDAQGPVKEAYRRFNINAITAGDDYAAMRQALTRRYTRQLKEAQSLPDILLIDGGLGQVNVAKDVLNELQLSDDILLLGVSKGPARRAGEENLVLAWDRDRLLHLGPESAALHLIQQIRDEAHRFAITAHRGRRGKARMRSSLEDISGLGPKRRAQLLKEFGGIQGVRRASEKELARVSGIGPSLAEQIYAALHGAAQG